MGECGNRSTEAGVLAQNAVITPVISEYQTINKQRISKDVPAEHLTARLKISKR
jgi:hypothetical protein